METEVYIDGDILPYKVGFKTQRMLYRLDLEGLHTCSPFLITSSKREVSRVMNKVPNLIVSWAFFVEEPLQALETLKRSIQNIVKGSQCNRFKVVLSGDTNFREDIATIQKYKGNRDDSVKPHHFEYLRDWLKEMPYTIISDNEEADDVLSKAMMQGHVGATIDKDLNNTPGLHYNFNTNERYEVDALTASYNFYRQMLVGDRADNIPGIKGVGAVTAHKLLTDCKTANEMEDVIYEKYEEVYEKPIEAMTEVGRLLWMRRVDNEMWTPTLNYTLKMEM